MRRRPMMSILRMIAESKEKTLAGLGGIVRVPVGSEFGNSAIKHACT